LYWESVTDIDHGNGIDQGTEIGHIRITPNSLTRGQKFTSFTAGNQDEQEQEQSQCEQLSAHQRTEIETLLPLLAGIATGVHYRLSNFVNDEGTHSERISVTIGSSNVKTFYFQQGGNATECPPIVAQLYRLTVGRPIPFESERISKA